ncbi:hypothetical protein BpHYR1_042817 [Brachionus plicatilis]|uniref:Uncharacterized protein n=1 Tax=Brachionus plicatilis TaxID=10195 RepID=A0A3M7Q4M4_BRAPC|nr:hypothetical protein BpHYR1_042817 [Brachionus plicatilis]
MTRHVTNGLKATQLSKSWKLENSDLNDQITFLCQKMIKKRENKTKQSPASIQKFIYIFEFISANRSILTELGISKEFIQTDSFLSLRDLKSSNFELNWFNLFDIILIKMHLDVLENEYLIFFVEKSEFLSNNGLKNYILFQSNFECQSSVICLKNVGLDKSIIENSVLFGSFSSVEAADPSQFNSILLKHNYPYGKDRNLTKKFFDNKLSLWENDSKLKLYDFGLVKGNIISVYEENCCFDFYCQSCHNNQINSEFLHQLDFDRSIKSWICNVCGNVSETPLIKIQIQKFTQDNENSFKISTLVDKHVGPTSCFITNINEYEIFAEEILLDIL